MAKKAKPKEVEHEEIEDGDYSIDIPEDDEPVKTGKKDKKKEEEDEVLIRPLEPFFIIAGKSVYPHPETLRIEPFKSIWERDKSPNNEVALQEFTYIRFMTSVFESNPFKGYHKDKREGIIIKEVIKEEKWKPDKLVKAGIAYIINNMQKASRSYNYLMSHEVVIDKLTDFNNELDFTERNAKSGMPIYKPSDIMRSAADASKIISGHESLKKRVQEELMETSRKTRGQKEISHFADPASLL